MGFSFYVFIFYLFICLKKSYYSEWKYILLFGKCTRITRFIFEMTLELMKLVLLQKRKKCILMRPAALKISSWSYEWQSLAVFLGFVGLCVCVCVCCSSCLFFKFSRQNSVNKSLIVWKSLIRLTVYPWHIFRTLQSVCESSNVNPCGENGICIPNYFMKTFTCKCDTDYRGIPCGKCRKTRSNR